MVPKDSNLRRLIANKANKITFGNTMPNRSEGVDGDITIRNIRALGNHFCVKNNGEWYFIPLDHNFTSYDDIDRIKIKRPAKYVGEIGFEENSGEFHFKQSTDDYIRYAGSTTKINRDVNDGNPAFQIGSSDAECFKITSTYTSGAKGLSSVTFDTLTASGTADMGEYFFKVDAIEKLHLNDNALTITTEGSATADTSILYLRNRGNHATAMDNTRVSIEFQQKLNDLGTETFRDSGKITVGTIGNEWGNTASEQDSYMSFSAALNGTMTEVVKIYSNGLTSFGTNKYLSLTDNEIDVSSGNLTLDVAGDIALSADGGNITMDDGTNTVFDFNVDGKSLKLSHNANDYATFTVADTGDLTIESVGDGTTDSDIILDADGKLLLYGLQQQWCLENADKYAELKATPSSDTSLVLYEHAGSSTDGYCSISVSEHGATTIKTEDGAASILTLDSASFIDLAPADNKGIRVDANCVATTNSTSTGLEIDYDHTGITASGQTITNEGVDVALNSDSPTHVGIVVNKGYSATLTGGTSGTQTGTVFHGTVTGHTKNEGLYLNVADGGTDIKLVSSADIGDYCTISTTTHGATTIATKDDDGSDDAHLTLDPDGDLIVSGADVKIDTGKKIYLDGGGDTYIFEHSADHVRLFVGGDNVVRFSESSDGNQVYFTDSSAGFTQLEPTFNGINTTVNFRASNKQNLTLTNNLTNLNLYFPLMSGNFTLVVTQDGTGSRTISNYKAFDNAGNAASGSSTVKFPGGSNPTLTTATNHVDIVSFYWDADNEIAYGVATLDFQD